MERKLEKGLISIIILLFLSSILTSTNGISIPTRCNEIRVYARIVDIREEEWSYQSNRISLKIQILEEENIGYEEMPPMRIGDYLEAFTFEGELGPFSRGDIFKAHLRRSVYSSGEWSIVSYEKIFNSNYFVIGYTTLNLFICLSLIILIEVRRWRNKKNQS
ncbi:MAG: hypothetical protein JW939_03385 [Candidatus Thermoplasmatota archaeon]|nr:hypothetical protein [Candidatus Thermoplasmatota archaeon]